MEDVFKFKYLTYKFRNVETFNRSNVNSVKYGTETSTHLGVKVLLNGYKELTSISTFKSKINNSETDECPWRLFEIFIQQFGFINKNKKSVTTETFAFYKSHDYDSTSTYGGVPYGPINSCCLFPVSFLDLPPFSLFSAHQVFEFLDLADSVTALFRHIVKLQNKNIWEVKHKDSNFVI